MAVLAAAVNSTIVAGDNLTALARQLAISRDTIHRCIRAGDLDRDLDTMPVRYGPRRPVRTKPSPPGGSVSGDNSSSPSSI
jgi:hypothetical protein